MKIAFVTASVSRKAGGLHKSVRRLAQGLSNSASYVQAFALNDEYTAQDRASWHPVSVLAFASYGPARFGFAPGLTNALVASDAQLVMSHGLWMYPSVSTTRWHAITGRPYIVHPHGMLDPWAVRNSRLKKRVASMLYERKHLQNAACIRALCESEARAIRAYGLQNPIAVIPNGVDLPVEEQGTVDGSRSSVIGGLNAAGRKVLLYLGRLHPKKGLVNLLKAWAALRHSRPSALNSQLDQWVLAIAGWDQNGHEAELKRLARDLNLRWSDLRSLVPSDSQPSPLNSQLVFLGPQFGPDKANCYRHCDAFILPSFSEGIPMVILEAWAYAKPVLMTPECNLPEGFNSNAAIRVEGNPESIERGLEQLTRLSASDLHSVGNRGRALVVERFAWPNVAAQMKAVYEWALGGGTAPGCVIE